VGQRVSDGGRRPVAADEMTAGLSGRDKEKAIMKGLKAMWGKLDAAAKQKWKRDAPMVKARLREGNA
jgi:hypothetical protein